ncbi:hypothetical protein GF336_05395 [Candidatus Woesearchaeota archaeon]|nr:hypothetical protein [Candidatus Woesearchaeota archaeon]
MIFDLSFITPTEAFYATSPSWDRSKYELPFKIPKHATSDLKRDPYRPIPIDTFYHSLKRLEKIETIEMTPSGIKEAIDRDRFENLGCNYLMADNVLMRFRKDSSYLQKEPLIHTFSMIGSSKNILELSKKIDLPHPFDDDKYPYRDYFHQEGLTFYVLQKEYDLEATLGS